MKIENIFPFAFPFWYWRTQNGTKSKGFPWTLHSGIHASFLDTIYGRANYSSDESHLQQANVIQDWGNDMQVKYWWHSTGWNISSLSTEDFEKIKDNNTDNLDATTKCFLKAISTTCKAMGHTEQAAKDARRCCFAMLDYFGLNSLFLSTTPDNECSFRVRLYCKPQYWVRSIYSKIE